MSFRKSDFILVDVTLPVEESNDPLLLKDIGVQWLGVSLPIRVWLFPDKVSVMFGSGHYIFNLHKLQG